MLALTQECCYTSGKEVTWQGHRGSHIFYNTQTEHTAASPTAFLPLIPSPLGAGRIKSINNTEAKRRYLPESHEEQRRGPSTCWKHWQQDTACRSPGSGKQETKGTSLGLTFSLSLQRLSPEQLWLTRARTALDPRCWHVAGPSFCTPANTHLGPTVIPEQINCYVGAKEGQGDLWEVPL